MLYIVLILVLAALGLLVTALITANSLWAWTSIGLSIVAGIILVVDFARRRSNRAAVGEEGETDGDAKTEADGEPAQGDELAADESPFASDSEEPAETESSAEKADQTEVLPAAGKLDDKTKAEDGDADAAEDNDPAEEETDAADLLVVSELGVEVVVVDEYPRYHLTDCRWLADRDTIPIAVSEARDLGFTPCARCGPDAKLAAKYRTKGRSPAE